MVVVGRRASDDLVQKVGHRLHGGRSAVVEQQSVDAVDVAVSVVAAPPVANDTALVSAVAEAAPGVEVPPAAAALKALVAAEHVPAVEPVAA